MAFVLEPIGVVHSEHKLPRGVPVQAAFADARSFVEIFPPFRAGLADLADFERIWLVFWCHMSRAWLPRIVPFLDTEERGVFATRAPARPNPIGLSAVKLIELDLPRGILVVAGVDIVDGTPLLDVKPYVPRFDAYPQAKAGWLENKDASAALSDQRFSQD